MSSETMKTFSEKHRENFVSALQAPEAPEVADEVREEVVEGLGKKYRGRIKANGDINTKTRPFDPELDAKTLNEDAFLEVEPFIVTLQEEVLGDWKVVLGKARQIVVREKENGCGEAMLLETGDERIYIFKFDTKTRSWKRSVGSFDPEQVTFEEACSMVTKNNIFRANGAIILMKTFFREIFERARSAFAGAFKRFRQMFV